MKEQILLRTRETESGCWELPNEPEANGYVRTRINGVRWLAHRASFTAFKGGIPEGLQVNHLCKNRACCNPDHLQAATSRENLLHGDTPNAVNEAKTECDAGHPFDVANTGTQAGGKKRYCRKCSARRSREYKRRQRDASQLG